MAPVASSPNPSAPVTPCLNLAAAAASPSLPIGLESRDAANHIMHQVFAQSKDDPSLNARILPHVATLWSMYCTAWSCIRRQHGAHGASDPDNWVIWRHDMLYVIDHADLSHSGASVLTNQNQNIVRSTHINANSDDLAGVAILTLAEHPTAPSSHAILIKTYCDRRATYCVKEK